MSYSKAHIINYFKQICVESRILKTFIEGDRNALKKRLADAEKNKIEYPFLSIDIASSNKEVTNWKTYEIDMFIGANVKPDDYQKQNDIIQLLDEHTDYLQHYMENVHEPPSGMKITFGRKTEDAQGYTADNVIGFYIEIDFKTKVDCTNFAAHFNALSLNDFATPSFSWVFDGTNYTLVNTSSNAVTSQFYWQKHNGSYQKNKELPNLTFAKPPTDFYIYLECTAASGFKTYARCYFTANETRTSGTSYPVFATDTEGNFISQNPNGLN